MKIVNAGLAVVEADEGKKVASYPGGGHRLLFTGGPDAGNTGAGCGEYRAGPGGG